MRVLFVENRYSTLLWREAAEGVASEGHEIHWMVQNHMFRPRGVRDNVHLLPYPGKTVSSDSELEDELKAIARTDRALRLFGVRHEHYGHYYLEIQKILNAVKPDIVIGEATQFHELMAISWCKLHGVLYISPNSTRYPVGRLVFWKADTFETIGGGGESLSDADAEHMLSQITARSVQPSYMSPPKQGLATAFLRAWEQLRVAIAWVLGERFITPSPWRRLTLARKQAEARHAWDEISIERNAIKRCEKLTSHDLWVFYPLQLQPESNLDVYGQPWINQAETLERSAVELATRGALIVVKPNPKSKYEMNSTLVELVRRHSNIIPLPHAYPMGKIFPKVPLTLSVTGTVILESIFASKPVCVLGEHELSRLPGVTKIKQPERVADILELVHRGKAVTASRTEALAVIKELHSSSYDALLWDPIARPDLFKKRELERLRDAFRSVVNRQSKKY